jgi:ribulose-phosphate 3-epimerase
MEIQILPSLLAADFGHLEDGARKAEQCGADALHLDIMDAHFVPNLSMGPAVVEMAHRCIRIPLSTHLMMSNPDRYLETFIKAGADPLLIHIEADADIPAALKEIRRLGSRAGITLNPETPADDIFPVLADVDEVLCMSVHPGYGGQAFIPEVLPKIRAVRDRANAMGRRDLNILVDGGINIDTAVQCAAHGASALIAGTSLYKAADMAEEVSRMRQKAGEAFDPGD